MIKKIVFSLFIITFCYSCAYADWNTYETKREAYDRRSFENYQTFQSNNNQQPLGGYNRPINDNGGMQFGSNHNQGMNSFNINNNYSQTNNSNYSDNWNRLSY